MQDCLWSWVTAWEKMGPGIFCVAFKVPISPTLHLWRVDTLSLLGGCVCITCDSLSCNGKLPQFLWRKRQEDKVFSGLMGTSANTVGIGREEDGFEYFQTRVAKTSHVKFVDGSPSDKYMEEIGGNYKNHGRKPSPPKRPDAPIPTHSRDMGV